MKNPCYGCQNRKLKCHSKCEAYQTWKKKHDDDRLREYERKQSEYFGKRR